MNEKVNIFGIRHHGPGSAQSIRQALSWYKPDYILIEGPPEADELVHHVTNPKMKPPVALLIYASDSPQLASFFPFAEFSPEWQALRYSCKHQIPARFIDLPQIHQLAERDVKKKELTCQSDDNERIDENGGGDHAGNAADNKKTASEDGQSAKAICNDDDDLDPLGLVAKSAGFDDGEEWWDHTVEHRRSDHEIFPAISEAMTLLRDTIPQKMDPEKQHRDELREAYMRRCIRLALKQGFEKIAVICGAWHVPALSQKVTAKQDNDLLKGLSKIKVSAAWVPWTYGRLTIASGYGAGIKSPGWYHHLWQYRYNRSTDERSFGESRLISCWMVTVARLLREQKLDVSSAHLIEALRLIETLAAVRNKPLPGLEEINEAIISVLCFGEEKPLQLIFAKLIVGERLGCIADTCPEMPLQKDLRQQQKTTRLKPSAVEKNLDLDLRTPNGLRRSHLLHRLTILNIPWGQIQKTGYGKKGTFHEIWTLLWNPEFAVNVIEAGIWGNTIEIAATNKACRNASDAESLSDVAGIIDLVLLADLPDAVQTVSQKLNNKAAQANDVTEMMAAVKPLTNIIRYGNVRQTDASIVATLFDHLISRICIGLGNCSANLEEGASSTILGLIRGVNDSLDLLQNPDHLELWQQSLSSLAERTDIHMLIHGAINRILLDANVIDSELVGKRIACALSLANEPVEASAWLEGFLGKSAMILLYDDRLWSVLDQWLCGLAPDEFTETLPLIRRIFSKFSAPERSQLGARVKQCRTSTNSNTTVRQIDHKNAEKVLPLLELLFGVAHDE